MWIEQGMWLNISSTTYRLAFHSSNRNCCCQSAIYKAIPMKAAAAASIVESWICSNPLLLTALKAQFKDCAPFFFAVSYRLLHKDDEGGAGTAEAEANATWWIILAVLRVVAIAYWRYKQKVGCRMFFLLLRLNVITAEREKSEIIDPFILCCFT